MQMNASLRRICIATPDYDGCKTGLFPRVRRIYLTIMSTGKMRKRSWRNAISSSTYLTFSKKLSVSAKEHITVSPLCNTICIVTEVVKKVPKF
jgi:hypothetical protein